MSLQLRSEQVWETLEKEIFGVLGMVTAKGESRTVGIVYIVRDHKLYVGSGKEAWKVRHIAQNGHVSLTVPIAKRIPLLPWVKIPAATITFSGCARVLPWEEVTAEVREALFRGMANSKELLNESAVIEIVPQGRFMTYGVGVRLMEMRDPEKARGFAPVGRRPGQRPSRRW